jgi:hypothetical protein
MGLSPLPGKCFGVLQLRSSVDGWTTAKQLVCVPLLVVFVFPDKNKF